MQRATDLIPFREVYPQMDEIHGTTPKFQILARALPGAQLTGGVTSVVQEECAQPGVSWN